MFASQSPKLISIDCSVITITHLAGCQMEFNCSTNHIRIEKTNVYGFAHRFIWGFRCNIQQEKKLALETTFLIEEYTVSNEQVRIKYQVINNAPFG